MAGKAICCEPPFTLTRQRRVNRWGGPHRSRRRIRRGRGSQVRRSGGNPSEEQQHAYGSHDRCTRHHGKGEHTHRAILETSGTENLQCYTPDRSNGLPDAWRASLTEARPGHKTLRTAPSRRGSQATGPQTSPPETTVSLQSRMVAKYDPHHGIQRFTWCPSGPCGKFGDYGA